MRAAVEPARESGRRFAEKAVTPPSHPPRRPGGWRRAANVEGRQLGRGTRSTQSARDEIGTARPFRSAGLRLEELEEAAQERPRSRCRDPQPARKSALPPREKRPLRHRRNLALAGADAYDARRGIAPRLHQINPGGGGGGLLLLPAWSPRRAGSEIARLYLRSFRAIAGNAPLRAAVLEQVIKVMRRPKRSVCRRAASRGASLRPPAARREVARSDDRRLPGDRLSPIAPAATRREL